MNVGKSINRVDAFEKVTGRAKYTADLYPRNALTAKIIHSTIANGVVKSVDTAEALQVPGVVKVITCFDVPEYYFPTAGHPWSTDPDHQDIADRLLLSKRVRFYGEDVAVVLAEDEIAARHGAEKVKIEYEEYPFVLDQIEAMQDGAPQLHEAFPNNILAHTSRVEGDYDEAIREEGLLCVDKWYETPIIQHCHIENHICCSFMESGRVAVITSTQIPHIVRRCVGQALGIPWGDVRIIKPYIGGGFGNKQDALYEPLCAYLATQADGRPVKLDLSREENFVSTRVRHAFKFHFVTYFRKDGTFVARQMEAFSKQGAYASHGHSIAAKSTNAFAQLYRSKAFKFDAYTIFTNTPVSGAMRAYGIPQVTFAMESHVDDIARVLDMDPAELRRKNMMEKGFVDDFTNNVNYYDSHEQCMQKGMKYIGWEEKRKQYAHQTGAVRRGVGMSIFWYNTAVWPVSLEMSACRMALNQDGSIQFMTGETEIGQGAHTVFCQMVADTVGVPVENVHMASLDDTDVQPFGTSAYASRQTYVCGMAIKHVGEMLRDKVFGHVERLKGIPKEELDLVNGVILHKADQMPVMTLGELSTEVLYSLEHSEHIVVEGTYQCKSNALSLGCAFAEVEVDIPMCKVKLLNVINVHDCGILINPQVAQSQIHGGMSMSIGFGLGEQLLIDEKTGRVLNGNFLDYKLSTAMDHPHLEAQFVENPEPTSPFGVKGLGEPPAVPAAPAIRNAILQATGTAIDQAPMTPHILFERFREEKLI